MWKRAIQLGGVIILVAVLLAACTVGPNYKKPPVAVPPEFKEMPAPGQQTGDWKPAEPRDAVLGGRWWTLFNDAQLSGLEQQVAASNQTIAEAAARFAAARAAVVGARSALFPTVTAGANASRSRVSSNRTVSGRQPQQTAPGLTISSYQLPIDATYEIDFWGRVRRQIESNVAAAQASAADLATATLSMQTELAVDYFQLRGLDAEQQLLASTVAGYERALQLTILRHNQGVASGVDVAQAQTQLETTRAQATDLGVTRAQLEHAIAVLLGKPPAAFALPLSDAGIVPPSIPVAVPSALLERRPDVAAAERRMASANAAIGVAKAAYYPTLSLSASGGLESSTLSTLFALPSRFWSIGPSLIQTVFDGGKRRALTEQAAAGYQESVATYRQTALSAFADVEDNLAALRILAQEASEHAAAVEAANRALELATSRYQGGITTYLEVITAQATALNNQRTAIELLTRRMVASVLLVKAVGGGWTAADLPQPAIIKASR